MSPTRATAWSRNSKCREIFRCNFISRGIRGSPRRNKVKYLPDLTNWSELPMFEMSTFFVVAFILLQAVVVQSEDKGKDDSDNLAGVWKCVSGVNDGKPLPEDIVKQLKLTLTKDKYKTEKGAALLFEGVYKIDAHQQ